MRARSFNVVRRHVQHQNKTSMTMCLSRFLFVGRNPPGWIMLHLSEEKILYIYFQIVLISLVTQQKMFDKVCVCECEPSTQPYIIDIAISQRSSSSDRKKTIQIANIAREPWKEKKCPKPKKLSQVSAAQTQCVISYRTNLKYKWDWRRVPGIVRSCTTSCV